VKTSILSIATVVALTTIGCGGGGSPYTPPANSSTTTSGKAVEGYLSGATVCFDMNNNGTCDAGEPSTVSDANGSFALAVTSQQKADANQSAPILVSGGVDIDNNKALIGVLKAPYKDTTATINITPLTTMVTAMVANGTSIDNAYATVGKALGLTATQVKSDPIADNNQTVLGATMTINRLVGMMAGNADVSKKSIYDALVTSIQQVADANGTKGILAIVTKATNDANSTLPAKAKETGKVVKVVENQIAQALADNPGNRQYAALVSDAVVENIQTILQTKLDNNESLTATDIENIDTNATDAADAADPIKISLENLLTSYFITYTPADITNLKNEFNALADINIQSVSTLTGISTPSTQTVVDALALVYKKEQIKIYASKLGKMLNTTQITIIANSTATPAFSKTMSTEDFAKLLYNTSDATLMKISLELTNPSALSSIDKAKQLFTDLRTQATSVSNFDTNQTQGINTAINNIALNANYDSFMFNMLNNDISYAMDTNQSTLQVHINSERDIKLTKSNTGGNIVWNYDINSSTQTWSGSVTYADVNPTTFDPVNFSTLHANLTGTLPIDYTAVTKEGVVDSQDISLDANVSKITGGANINMTANISSNGDSITLTNLNTDAFYDVNATNVTPKYVRVNKVYVNGVAGQYSINGELDVNAYTLNKSLSTKNFIETTSSIYPTVVCDHNSTFDYAHASVTLNGQTYTPSLQYSHSDAYHDNVYQLSIENIDGALTYDDYQAISSNLKCSGNLGTQVYYGNNYNDTTPYNSGYLPSKVTFKGTIKDNQSNILEATLNIDWNNATDMNISDDNATPSITATLDGTLTMPSSPVMNVVINYNNVPKQHINATYAYGTTAITIDAITDATFNSTFDDDIDTASDKVLKNGTIKVSSASGITANVKIANGTIDDTNSTLEDINGTIIGRFEKRSNVPVVKYIDGTFESIP